jgi:hypothetical protein
MPARVTGGAAQPRNATRSVAEMNRSMKRARLISVTDLVA